MTPTIILNDPVLPVCFWRDSPPLPSGSGPPHSRGFLITQRHTTVGRTPLDEGASRRRDLYLTTNNIHNRQTAMPPAGLKPVIPENKQLQTQALDHAATGTGCYSTYLT